jgi:hypothetical protein
MTQLTRSAQPIPPSGTRGRLQAVDHFWRGAISRRPAGLAVADWRRVGYNSVGMTAQDPAPDVTIEVADLPYAERQRILVAADADVTAERVAAAEAMGEHGKVDWRLVAITAAGAIISPSTFAVETIVGAVRKLRESGFEVLTIARSEAQALVLPPGHPRDRVVYIGHPAAPSVYFPAASFHQLVFESKLSEAARLLMSLGAKELSVEHVRGWSHEFAANLSVSLPAVEGPSATAKKTDSHQSSALFRATLIGDREPSVPPGLVWLPHEPTWQQIAEGRMEYGLQEFDLSVRYEDDYGVNLGLKAEVQKVGLDLGGRFETHQSTVWNIKGKFGSPG